jgi:hypothetical protein
VLSHDLPWLRAQTDVNSAVYVHYQYGIGGEDDAVYCALLSDILEKPAYQQLR